MWSTPPVKYLANWKEVTHLNEQLDAWLLVVLKCHVVPRKIHFLKIPSTPLKVSPQVSYLWTSPSPPQKINRAGEREPTIVPLNTCCSAARSVRVWWEGERGESVHPRGSLRPVWGLLRGYHYEHAPPAREEGGSREMGGVHTLLYTQS